MKNYIQIGKRLNEIIRGIKSDKKWLALITEKAEKKGISLDEAIEKDAEFIIWKENENK